MKIPKRIWILNIAAVILIFYFVVKNTIFYLPFFDGVEKVILHSGIYFSTLIGVIINAAIGVWLYIDAKTKNQPALIWATLALFFGLIALFTYYWRLIYLKLEQNNE